VYAYSVLVGYAAGGFGGMVGRDDFPQKSKKQTMKG
jgi:hypothetical protein